jgi:PST family polysaccharide transporter
MAVLQADHVSEKAKSSLLIINTSLGFVLGFLLFISAQPVAEYYGDDRLDVMMKFLAIVPVLGGIQSQFRLHLIRSLRFTGIAISDVVAQFFSTLVAIILAIHESLVEAIIWQSLTQAGSQLLFTIMLARWIPRKPGKWKSEVKELILVGLRIFGATALRDSSRSLVVPLMGSVIPASSLGNYDRAQQLAVLPINLTVDQLQRVAVPVLSRLRDQPEKMYSYMRRAQLMLTYLTVTVFMILAALAEPLVLSILGPDWTLAGQVLAILSLGAVFRTLGQSMQWLFIASETTAVALKFSLWSQPLIVAITLAGLPWGVLGGAIANSIAWTIHWPIATVTAAHASGFRAAPLITDAARGIATFGLPIYAVTAAVKLLDLDSWQEVAVGLFLAMLTSGLLFISIGPIKRDLLSVLKVFRLAFGKS